MNNIITHTNQIPLEMDKLIEIAEHVYQELGYGHSEATYHKAYNAELQAQGFKTTCEYNLTVTYTDTLGNTHYLNTERIDIMVHDFNENRDKVVIELKAISRGINSTETTQLNKYFHQLKKNKINVSYGVIINFNPLSPKTINDKTFESMVLKFESE
jgi:GxxExxY protein